MHEFFLSKSGSSRIQEFRVSEDVGGRKVPASGAFEGNKGDVETKAWLIDAKLTEKKSFALSLKVLRKIDAEALAYGKVPALAIEFTNTHFGVTRKWAVIPYNVFVKLVQPKEGV